MTNRRYIGAYLQSQSNSAIPHRGGFETRPYTLRNRAFLFVCLVLVVFSLAGPSWAEDKKAAPAAPAPTEIKGPAGTELKPQLDKNDAKTPPKVPAVKADQKVIPDEEKKLTDPVDPETFDKAYRAFSKNNHEKAATLFLKYITENTTAVDDYEWAEFFFGVSLKKLGYTHAAVDTLARLITRKPDVQIVNYSLEIFEDITRTILYDRDLVILRSICDQDFGFTDARLSDFIHYHQGVFDWENGFDDWGSKHFNQIRKGTYYYYQYRFQKALYDIRKNDIKSAITILEEIDAAEFKGEDLKNDVRKTLARLMYEKKNYPKADVLYQNISDNIVFQAQNLLERSWAQYRMKNPERAMGLLYAFKAPVYSNYFTPEYFLLKSFIYKDVCQYQRALAVIDEFRDHYKESLVNIYDRGDMTKNRALILSLLGQKKISDKWNFLQLLEEERKAAGKIKDPLLKVRLEKVYTLETEKVTKEFRILMRDKFESLANDLLEYEEKTDLMAYEIGLDMYQRIYQYHYREDKDKENAKKEALRHYYALFPFQGEFWTDELNAYKVVLEDKCACMEEWDIFFK